MQLSADLPQAAEYRSAVDKKSQLQQSQLRKPEQKPERKPDQKKQRERLTLVVSEQFQGPHRFSRRADDEKNDTPRTQRLKISNAVECVVGQKAVVQRDTDLIARPAHRETPDSGHEKGNGTKNIRALAMGIAQDAHQLRAAVAAQDMRNFPGFREPDELGVDEDTIDYDGIYRDLLARLESLRGALPNRQIDHLVRPLKRPAKESSRRSLPRKQGPFGKDYSKATPFAPFDPDEPKAPRGNSFEEVHERDMDLALSCNPNYDLRVDEVPWEEEGRRQFDYGYEGGRTVDLPFSAIYEYSQLMRSRAQNSNPADRPSNVILLGGAQAVGYAEYIDDPIGEFGQWQHLPCAEALIEDETEEWRQWAEDLYCMQANYDSLVDFLDSCQDEFDVRGRTNVLTLPRRIPNTAIARPGNGDNGSKGGNGKVPVKVNGSARRIVAHPDEVSLLQDID